MSADIPRQKSLPESGGTGQGSGLLTWLILGVAAALFLAYVVWRPRIRDPMGVNHPVVGQRLLVFEVEPLTGDGEPLGLGDLSGKVTLINIWGTWCDACAEEFPYLTAIYEKHKRSPDFQYVSISYDDKSFAELTEATDAFLRRMRTDHSTYHDPGAKTLQALYMLGVENSFPTTLVLDRSGTIRGVWLGYSRPSMVQIERLLGEMLLD